MVYLYRIILQSIEDINRILLIEEQRQTLKYHSMSEQILPEVSEHKRIYESMHAARHIAFTATISLKQ